MSCAAYRITTNAEAQAMTVVVTARAGRQLGGLLISVPRISLAVLAIVQAWQLCDHREDRARLTRVLNGQTRTIFCRHQPQGWP
jgi:hypothetical protein